MAVSSRRTPLEAAGRFSSAKLSIVSPTGRRIASGIRRGRWGILERGSKRSASPFRTQAFLHEDHGARRTVYGRASSPTSEVPSHFGSLGRLSTGRTQGVSKQFAVLKGVGDFEEFHLLHQPYLLNRFQLMYKQSRCRAQMLLTTTTAKTGRKALKNTENGPKTVSLRVKSACSEVFFASKGPLLGTESGLEEPVLYTLERSLK